MILEKVCSRVMKVPRHSRSQEYEEELKVARRSFPTLQELPLLSGTTALYLLGYSVVATVT